MSAGVVCALTDAGTDAGADLLPGDAVDELVLANRVLANEGVLDGFGHVSLRYPGQPDRYLLSRSRSPGLVEAGDIRAFDLQSRAVRPDERADYVERVIHGCIYLARPDVGAVCHFHAPAVLPFASTGVPLRPVIHLGALMGPAVPFWDARETFGDTDLLVSTPEQGASLARALGGGWSALLRRHGAVVCGRTLREAVFRAIVLVANADVQARSQAMGEPSPLTAAEVELSSQANLRPGVQGRLWEWWCARLPGRSLPDRSGGAPEASS